MKTNTNISGTSFFGGEIECSVNDLIKVLGEPTYNSNDGQDKTNIEWNMETKGIVFTLYDWKMYRPITYDESIRWHIGVKSQFESSTIQILLEKLIYGI
jgi:hypothetical protein